eukprot:TRINITY_DN43675_c0_g1_i1.p1 TRINITY_DN43675_c0_g1~~TRINITY_DN43675_c0_g1_i1.p1  ORF type:complete len:256 (+),score=40.29 TRINITY_DN43675_c0_g1_i1:49-816(+)
MSCPVDMMATYPARRMHRWTQRRRCWISAPVVAAAVLVATLLGDGPCWSAGASAMPRRSALAAGVTVFPLPVFAFENRVREVQSQKNPGEKPKGVGTGTGIISCGQAPNCFSSAKGTDEEHFLAPWRFANSGMAGAVSDLEKVIRAYPPGQQDIDGGGFDIKVVNASTGYIYVQFESLRKGYIDDVEFAIRLDSNDAKAGEVLVRSSSRLGYLDFRVNAKRLNKIAADLVALSADRWTAPLITSDSYPRYFKENR